VSPFAALHGLRVGCVQYLNAKPLIVPYDGEVIFEHPARLADLLAAGQIDLALVPVFEALRQPDFPVVDGVSISSCGPVYSVVLAHRGPIADLQSAWLDPASRTSNNLLRCILAEFRGIRPRYHTGQAPSGISDHEGVLLIGNQAIRHRQQPREGIEYLDFGEEWLARTGLPFVYAVWQIRAEIPHPAKVAEALRAMKCAGLSRAREIAHLQREFDPAFAEHYLTAHIKFDLADREKAGLTRFSALLRKHALLAPGEPTSLHFV
jgi:predicted solute-binding protein